MPRNRKAFVPIVSLFVVLTGFFVVAQGALERWGADQSTLLFGNLLLFVITIVSFLMAQRGLKNTNPHAFVRSVYGSIMLKLFVCLIAAVIYIATLRSALNKPAFFTLMGLYLVYTFIEVSTLTKLLKGRANG